jgi:hypothetical protein
MRVKISKSKFSAEQIECLQYWITRQGIQPIRNKVEAILNIKAPKTRKNNKLRQFIGIVNYYRDMRFYRNELLAWFHWLASHQSRSSLNGTHPINRPLIKLRKLWELTCDVLLCYPDFNKDCLFIFTLMHQASVGGSHRAGLKTKSHLFVKAQYSSKVVYNHWDRQRVVINYWNLQGIQEYPDRLPLFHHGLNRP